MHCLSAREYRVGVDVVSDAVQVDPILDQRCFGLTIFLSWQAALNAELAEIRRIQTSMAQVGKLDFFKETDLIRLGIRRNLRTLLGVF